MHGHGVPFLVFFWSPLFGVDDLIEEDLIMGGDLCQVFVGFMVPGDLLALVEEAHVLGHANIWLRLFVYDVFDSFQVSTVVVFLVQRGCEPVVCGTIVIKSLLHIGRNYKDF